MPQRVLFCGNFEQTAPLLEWIMHIPNGYRAIADGYLLDGTAELEAAYPQLKSSVGGIEGDRWRWTVRNPVAPQSVSGGFWVHCEVGAQTESVEIQLPLEGSEN